MPKFPIVEATNPVSLGRGKIEQSHYRCPRPSHACFDGDTIFSAATGVARQVPNLRDRIEIGMAAADCLARAIARAVYEAEPPPFPGALPSWRGKFEGR